MLTERVFEEFFILHWNGGVFHSMNFWCDTEPDDDGEIKNNKSFTVSAKYTERFCDESVERSSCSFRKKPSAIPFAKYRKK